jgi:thiamine biosynthesis protein ThiS
MRVTVNGVLQEVPEQTDVAQLLATLKVAPERVAVEINLTILDARQSPSVHLKEGDRVEIIHFVGGGGTEAYVLR